MNRLLGAAAGLALDQLIGEPPLPERLHPLALFGSASERLEERIYADDRFRGALYVAATTGLAAGIGRALGSSVASTYVAASGRALHRAALDIHRSLGDDDIGTARSLLPTLVGRDPDGLDRHEIARATVESVAENTSDAIVAPALWTALAGSTGCFVHRAADTIDSMVGYRNDRYRSFGTAAARLDDAMAWAPARVTAVLVALVRPSRARDVWETVRQDAAAHPSPNAGVVESAFAAALDVQLGGSNVYGGVVETRPQLGSGRVADPSDILAAVRVSRDVTWVLAGLLGGVGLLWRRRR